MKYHQYRSGDGHFVVQLGDQVIRQILKQVKIAGRYETGGILVGHYDDGLQFAVIESATKEPGDSRKGFTWFNRGIKGLQRLLNIHWNKHRYYLGEWHLHPFASAGASGTDIVQMLAISKDPKYQCPEPVLLIIGGSVDSFEIRVYIFIKGKKYVELSPVIDQALSSATDKDMHAG